MKVFTCPKEGCESRQFILAVIEQTLVDFSQEGAVEGYPRLEHLSTSSASVFCQRCQNRVLYDFAQEILRETLREVV